MVELEIRRHAERAPAGADGALTAAGLAAARALRSEGRTFVRVISSPRERAIQTAAAIAGHVDETNDLLAVSSDDVLTQAQYDAMRWVEDVLELLGAKEASLRFAQGQLTLWESIAHALPDGATALVVTHGGNIELPAALLARSLGQDLGPLPLSYCEGVRIRYVDGRCSDITRLGVTTNSPVRARDEVPLGGNLSQSVRVGDTVRRRAAPWTPAVQLLLQHLEKVGFAAAPRSLGTDERGRAVLSYTPGDIHGGWPEPLPMWMFEDETPLVRAAELLRRYHDAVVTFLPGPELRWSLVAPGPHELICHNDWSPSNALFRGHAPILMLDWDAAGPGSRTWDAASSAYWWVPLSPSHREISLGHKASRLALFCRTYGREVGAEAVLDVLPDQLRFIAESIQSQAASGDPGAQKLARWDVPARLGKEAEELGRQRSTLTSASDRRS